jgi:hypothetical protein
LSYIILTLEVNGADIALGNIELVPGDVNGSGNVNYVDLSILLEGYGKIKAALAGEVKFIIDEIDKERRSSDDVVAMCEKYHEAANKVLKLYEEKIRRENLTTEEKEIVEFYKELGKAVAATSNLYK